MKQSLVFLLLMLPLLALAADGTREGSFVGSDAVMAKPEYQTQLTDDIYTITPFESVTICQTMVWQDNRHRAYYSSDLGNVNGFLLFDVSQIPDNAVIVSMTLRCYLENAFGSPASNPVVDIYWSGDDAWTRMSATAGSLSLDELVVNDIPFSSYVSSYDFIINVAAHNWSQDLLDNRICFGFKNDVTYYSYVYFFGAYGSPTGPAPQLIIETMTGTLPNLDLTLTPVNPPILIPSAGGSFNYNIGVANLGTNPATFAGWINVILPSGGVYGPVLGPLSITLPGSATISRLRTQNVPGNAPPGIYSYKGYVGYYSSTIIDSASFEFTKMIGAAGNPGSGEWVTAGESFTSTPLSTPQTPVLLEVYPNPFNPTTAISFELRAASFVSLRFYDTAGRLVETMVDGWQEAGMHRVTFDGSALSSGMYLYRLESGSATTTGKMLLMK